MTCVSAYVDNDGTIHMAADQAATYGSIVRRGYWQSKLIVRSNFLIGHSGTALEAQADRAQIVVSDLLGNTAKARRDELLGRFNAVRQQRSCAYLVGHKGELFFLSTDNACLSSIDCDFIGSDPSAFRLFFLKLMKEGHTGSRLVKETVRLASAFVPGVSCDQEGPDYLSI